ncbi:MAG: tetratricopeptide repeat protein [Spirochaetia bacterium]
MENILYISIPENFATQIGDFTVNPSILLPVELPPGKDKLDLKDLSWEMIITGMLRVLANDPSCENHSYYRDFIFAVKPDIINELSQTAVLKARNMDFELAEDIFQALVGLEPNEPGHIVNLALLFDQRAEQYEKIGQTEMAEEHGRKALEYYKQALSMDENFPDAHFNLAYFYLRNYRFEEARKHFSYFLSFESDGEKAEEAERIIGEIERQNLLDTLFKEAYDFIRLGEEERGIESISRFLEKNPKIWNAWFLLGWANRRLGNFGEAKTAFERSIELKADQPDTLNELAICCMELGEYQLSENYLRQALKFEPENVKVISNLGILSLKKGNKEEADAYFKAVLEMNPEDPIALQYLEHSDF